MSADTAHDPLSHVASWLKKDAPAANPVDPLPAMSAERDRLWTEIDNGSRPGDADKMRRADIIEEQIIGMVASSASGIIAQLRLAKELTEIDLLDGRDDREDRLNATIIAGVERLAGCAGATTVAPTPTAADDTDPVLALMVEADRLASQSEQKREAGEKIFSRCRKRCGTRHVSRAAIFTAMETLRLLSPTTHRSGANPFARNMPAKKRAKRRSMKWPAAQSCTGRPSAFESGPMSSSSK